MAATSSGYVVAAATPGNMFNRLMDTAMFDIFNVTSSTVAVVTTTGRPPGPTQISPAEEPTVVGVVSAAPTEEDYVVLPGPEDVLLFNSSNGLYQQSVTLTARMYPIEATAAKSIWGLPTLIWGILIGTIVILIVILATLFFCCWLQPRTRKLLSASYYATNTGSNVSHSSIVPKSQTSDSNQLVMPLSIGICPPQYSAPPPPGSGSGNNSGTSNQQQHPHPQQQICSAGSSSGIPCHGSNVSPAAVHHGSSSKYGSSPHQQQYAHQQQQQQYHQQQQQYQHHHQCIHHQQQQQQQQQYQAHYAHLQQQHQQQQQQQSYQQYYNQQQQQHQQQQQQQQLTQYIHPAQQQALQQQQQQREHQIQQQQQQHHYHHHQQQQQQQQQKQQKQQSQLVHHKSMWAINPLYASSGVISDGGSSGGGGGGCGPDGRDGDDEAGSTSYRTRSLPSWGKNKQRPLSNADDLEELYAKVNFSKKRRNRMRNDEAAIIALCRSRSQNLAALPMGADQDAVVVYDERTAL